MPSFTGSVARGVLLQLLGRVGPELSQELHEPNVRKAYSVTPLLFKSRSRLEDGYILDPSYPLRLRIRFLADGYARALLEAFQSEDGFMIYEASFRVASIRVSSRSYEQLLAESKPSEAFRLLFTTPTCFSALNQRYFYLFPEPKHVFGGLLRLWNLFSPVGKLDPERTEEYTKWVGSQVGVSGYELSTRRVSVGRRTAIGFRGWVNYRMGDGDEWRKLTEALGRLAEYSNVGKNRTGGFGVVRFVEKPGAPESLSSDS